jgi:hypothetical protein
MARASLELIQAIRSAARKIADADNYQWGHMGACNCGFLAQEITQLTKQEIHRRALQRHGDWSEQLNDYCPASGMLMDDLISELLAFGLTTDDLKHLERLSSPQVLALLPAQNYLHYNLKQDVVAYMTAWAYLLEEELVEAIELENYSPVCYSTFIEGT